MIISRQERGYQNRHSINVKKHSLFKERFILNIWDILLTQGNDLNMEIDARIQKMISRTRENYYVQRLLKLSQYENMDIYSFPCSTYFL